MLRKNIKCTKCGRYYDIYESMCPNCLSEKEIINAPESKKNLLMFDSFTQIILFVLGWVGLTFVSTITLSIWASIQSKELGITHNEFLQNLYQYPSAALYTNVISYLLCFIFMIITLIPKRKVCFKILKNTKPYMLGIIFGFALISLNIFIGYLINLAGGQGSNDNQTSLEILIGYSPVVSLLIFGFIGPIVEELSYRVGLFAYLNRIGKIWLAYLLSAIIFGLIHFNFNSADIKNELINLPSYLAAGLLLCYAYQKGGFITSTIAHVMNNVLSICMVIITLQ